MDSKDGPPNSLRSNQRPLQFLFTGDQAIALTARILTRFIIQKFGLLLPSTDGRPWVTVVVPAIEVELELPQVVHVCAQDAGQSLPGKAT